MAGCWVGLEIVQAMQFTGGTLACSEIPYIPTPMATCKREHAKGMWMGRCREDWLKYIAAQLVSLQLHGESLLQIVLIIYENLPPAFAAAFPEAWESVRVLQSQTSFWCPLVLSYLCNTQVCIIHGIASHRSFQCCSFRALWFPCTSRKAKTQSLDFTANSPEHYVRVK